MQGLQLCQLRESEDFIQLPLPIPMSTIVPRGMFYRSFLIGMVVELALTQILSSVGGSILGGDFPHLIAAAIAGDWASGFVDMLREIVYVAGAVASVVALILAAIASKIVPGFWTAFGLFLAFAGAIVAFYTPWLWVAFLGVVVAAGGVYFTFKGRPIHKTFDAIAKGVSIVCLVTSIMTVVLWEDT